MQGFVGFRRSHNMKGHSFGFLGLEARTTVPWRHVYRYLEVIPSASNILSPVISDLPPKQEEDTEGDDGLSLQDELLEIILRKIRLNIIHQDLFVTARLLNSHSPFGVKFGQI